MKTPVRFLAISLMATTLVACSDGGSGNTDPAQDDPSTTTGSTDGSGTTGSDTDGSDGGTTGTDTGGTTGSDTGGTTGTDTGGTTGSDAGTTGNGTTGSDTGGGTTGSDTGGTTGSDTGGTTGSDTGGTTGSDTGGTTGSDTDGGSSDGGTTGGTPPPSDGEVAPELPDPFAEPVPGPDSSDPFGSLLEVDDEVPSGDAPTTPKNLRVDLVSNDWAEINWAPSNGDPVAYNIYRSDGHIYTVSPDQTDPAGGTQAEIDKIWRTTSFIDCNYTRFLDRLHVCAENSPVPGNTYSYQVTAVDADGDESPRSNAVTITYHLPLNAPIPRYEDFYLDASDDFAQRNNFSQTEWFLNEFELMFSDEFDGTDIDSTKWNTELVWADTSIINGEQQYFVDTQNDPDFGYNPFNFTGSSLIIESVPVPDELRANLPEVCDEPDPFGVDRCEFLSGALSSHDKYGFIYGYVEGRMRVSGGAGALSSFYLYHRYPGSDEWLHAPEIDIVEYLGENPFGDEEAFQTHHFADVSTDIVRSAPTMSYANPDGSLFSEGYHTYGVLWEPQLVIWYIDGVEIKRMTGPMVGRQPMNIVTYLVAGSGWAPTPDVDDPDLFPLRYEIDYIRAYQRSAYQGTSNYGN